MGKLELRNYAPNLKSDLDESPKLHHQWHLCYVAKQHEVQQRLDWIHPVIIGTQGFNYSTIQFRYILTSTVEQLSIICKQQRTKIILSILKKPSPKPSGKGRPYPPLRPFCAFPNVNAAGSHPLVIPLMFRPMWTPEILSVFGTKFRLFLPG